MKKRIISMFSPVLSFLCTWGLTSLKGRFLSEDDSFRKILSSFGFHQSICNHPSIIWRETESSAERSFFVKRKLRIIKKCIKIRVLSTPAGNRMANRIGLHSFFLDKEAWFNSPSSSYIPYEVPEGMTDTKRLVVYTVLTGDYDDVHEILYKEDGVDYLLFTNNPKISSNTWHVFLINEAMDNLFLSRKIKILPHQYLPTRYNRSIYIDANAVIYGELSQLAHYLDEQICFAVSRHHERNSVRDEVIALVDRGMIDQEEAAGQYSRYQSEGFSDQLGLAECSILVRNHQDNDLKDVMELWWEEFKRGVKRDQVSLLPCIQKRHFSGFVFMNGYVRHNQFCRIVSHKG